MRLSPTWHRCKRSLSSRTATTVVPMLCSAGSALALENTAALAQRMEVTRLSGSPSAGAGLCERMTSAMVATESCEATCPPTCPPIPSHTT